MPTFTSWKLAQQNPTGQPDRNRRARAGRSPRSWAWPGSVSGSPPLTGLQAHLAPTPGCCQRQAKLTRLQIEDINMHINNHPAFKTRNRNFGLLDFIKRTFLMRPQLRLQFLWLPSTNIWWLNFSPNMDSSEKSFKCVCGICSSGWDVKKNSSWIRSKYKQ